MVSVNQVDRNDYSIASSEAAQANFASVASQLEAALERRDADVRQALSAYQADGVSDQYAALEQQWHTAAQQVRDVIQAIRTSLCENDEVARRALQQAGAAIPG